MVKTDKKRLQQVLLNLQSNALKFTKPGGSVVIKVQLIKKLDKIMKNHNLDDSVLEEADDEEYSKILEQMYKPEDTEKLIISVLDTGIGIRKADQKKLFNTFVCVKSALDMNQQGIGLGLCISKDIVEHFGGKIILK